MAPIHENAEQADYDDEEASYIEEEIIEDYEEILEEVVVEEEIVEDEVTIEEEIIEDGEDGGAEGAYVIASGPQTTKTDKKSSHKSEARSKLLQEIAAQRKLAENLKRQNSIARVAESRKQAAMSELGRSNSKLKVARLPRSIASCSTASSRGKSSKDRIQASVDVERINAVEIPQQQTPISPLRSRDESTRSPSRISKLKSKLKHTPIANSRTSTTTGSQSRVTEWIREDPMEKESKGTNRSEENARTGLASVKTKGSGTRSSVSRLKKQLSVDSSPQPFGQAGGQSGGVIPLKSRSNDMTISSTRETKPINEVDIFFTLAELQANSVVGIDSARREIYLCPKDFKANFNMTKEEFYKLPRWKQSEAKKALNLF